MVIFELFKVYLREFSIFVHEIVLVARSYRFLATDIKSLIVGALAKRLKIPILAIFDDLWGFSRCPFSISLLSGIMILLRQFSPIYALSNVIRDFSMTVSIKPKINKMQIRFSRNLCYVKCRF